MQRFRAGCALAAGSPKKLEHKQRTHQRQQRQRRPLNTKQDADDFCEEHPDVVVLAPSILSTAAVLRALPVQRLKRNTLFVDVLSVKAFPKQLLLRELPPEMDILCTHPMFGPDSGKGSWQGLNFMYEVVRVGHDAQRAQRVENFLKVRRCVRVCVVCGEGEGLLLGWAVGTGCGCWHRCRRCAQPSYSNSSHNAHIANTRIYRHPPPPTQQQQFFRAEGCRMVEMTCEEHDRQAASTQFITHTVGRVLGAMDVRPTDINTKGFDALLNLVENTSHDSFDLYYGLFLYNANATGAGRWWCFFCWWPWEGGGLMLAGGGGVGRLRRAIDTTLNTHPHPPLRTATLHQPPTHHAPPPPTTKEELQRLEQALDTVKKQLLGRMHDIVRQQLQLPGTGTDSNGGSGSSGSGSGGSSGGRSSPQPQRLLGPGAPHMELGSSGGSGEAASSGGGGGGMRIEVLGPEGGK